MSHVVVDGFVEGIGDAIVSGEGGKGQRGDDFCGVGRHDRVHSTMLLGQRRGDIGHFIGGDAG